MIKIFLMFYFSMALSPGTALAGKVEQLQNELDDLWERHRDRVFTDICNQVISKKSPDSGKECLRAINHESVKTKGATLLISICKTWAKDDVSSCLGDSVLQVGGPLTYIFEKCSIKGKEEIKVKCFEDELTEYHKKEVTPPSSAPPTEEASRQQPTVS